MAPFSLDLIFSYGPHLIEYGVIGRSSTDAPSNNCLALTPLPFTSKAYAECDITQFVIFFYQFHLFSDSNNNFACGFDFEGLLALNVAVAI